MTERRYDASAMLRDAATRHGIRLSTLIAETGLWANPEVHKKLLTAGGSGAFFPDRRRCRAGQGEQRGQRAGAVILDDNTYANGAIKRALGVSRTDLLGFEACHIWPGQGANCSRSCLQRLRSAGTPLTHYASSVKTPSLSLLGIAPMPSAINGARIRNAPLMPCWRPFIRTT